MSVRLGAFIFAIFTFATAFSCVDSPAPGSSSGEIRIAVLSPASAIILRDLGRESTVVARHGWDLALDESLPVAGDQTGLDYETLLRLDPTDIVLEQAAQDPPEKLRQLAESHGWRVHTLPMLTLTDIRGAITQLDRISSNGKTTEQAAELLARFDTAVSPADAAAGSLGRTLPLTWTDPVGVMGPGSFHAELLASLGATPIPAEGSPYITLDAEDVIRMDPDSIVLIVPGLEEAKLNDALGPLADAGLRAVQEGRVLLINHPHALTPSTSLIQIARALAERCREIEPVGAGE